MKTCVIGHRGVGKTTLANRLKSYFSGISGFDYIDLDEAVERRAGKKIFEIFIDHGEKYFRELEQQVFAEALQSLDQNLWIILGAGFDVDKIPSDVQVLWVRRETDSDGRIFLDRPRLDDSVKPLEEYLKRYADREVRYRKKATWTYLMPEGDLSYKKRAFSVEKELFADSFERSEAVLTLLPDMFIGSKWDKVVKKLKGRYKAFELRDDLLTKDEMSLALASLSDEKFIYSYRKNSTQILDSYFEADFYDWALEMGAPSEDFLGKKLSSRILSLHEVNNPMIFEQYADKATYFKWSPMVNDWPSLKFAHLWQRQDPIHRSFLPRSLDGRWKWYRLYQYRKMLLNFVKEMDGSAKDQPSLFEFMMLPDAFESFAAVLGDPVHHSWTPIEHSDYFFKKSMPVFAIRVKDSELVEAQDVLVELGMTHAAVTSPLKNSMAVWAHANLKAVNTLFIKERIIRATSTDATGLRTHLEGIEALGDIATSVVVWGGGGTLDSVEAVAPKAVHYSSRTGRARDSFAEIESPKIVIWAAPRLSETKMPPSDWHPSIVYDLNYKEDSLGREYAQLVRAKYESGETMFRTQAQAQRIFWDQCEEEI